jgi:hypothetical protein
MARKKKRQTLSEAEYFTGELIAVPFEGDVALMWCKDIYPFSLVTHYRACCIMGMAESIEEATQGAEALADGLRLPPDPDEPPSRKWPGFKKEEKKHGKKKTRSPRKSRA